ncbi:MAG: hypothetical protein ACREIP_02950, partial [Alphaproteobacteria bacterium]
LAQSLADYGFRNLKRWTRAALSKRPADCRAYAEGFSWRVCAELFLANLHPFGAAPRPAEACLPSPA